MRRQYNSLGRTARKENPSDEAGKDFGEKLYAQICDYNPGPVYLSREKTHVQMPPISRKGPGTDDLGDAGDTGEFASNRLPGWPPLLPEL